MSGNFKFLTQASSKPDTSEKAFIQEDAAQSFLDEKLSKNRFTIKQQETLDANGGPTVANSSADEFENNSFRSTAKEVTKKATPPPVPQTITRKTSPLTALGFDDARIQQIRNHAQGANGSGAFGYTSDTEHHFRETANGTSSGSIEADMRKIGQHLGYKHWGTANPERIKKFIMEQGEETIAAPVVEKEPEPIEHSPEIKQAKKRVKTYENDVLSGKVSEDIYGTDQYSFDAMKGAAGIGTPLNGSSINQADLAADSFLDNKKEDLKKKYQFIAQS